MKKNITILVLLNVFQMHAMRSIRRLCSSAPSALTLQRFSIKVPKERVNDIRQRHIFRPLDLKTNFFDLIAERELTLPNLRQIIEEASTISNHCVMPEMQILEKDKEKLITEILASAEIRSLEIIKK